MNILNFGSLNLDYVYSVDHILVGGETLSADAFALNVGGKGLNQSIAAARAGARVHHAGMIGAEGETLRAYLNENGVDTQHMRVCEKKQGHAIIQVDAAGQNCIVLYGGSNLMFSREYIDDVLAHFSGGDILMLQNEVSNVDYILKAAGAKGMRIVFNASPVDNALVQLDFKDVAWLVINEIEGYAITGEQEPDRIVAALTAHYPHMGVVLTLGQDGVICQNGGERVTHGIFDVQVKDTTAAGDTFMGYFVFGLYKDRSLYDCIRFASAASALAVTRAGAAPSIPEFCEVERGLNGGTLHSK